MRIILIAGVALALTACGSGNKAATNNTSTLTTNSATMNQTMPMDQNAMMGGNNMMGTNGMGNMGNMGMNGAANSSTQNAMMKDLKTNDPDTNLANGM